jgi:C1A family cysteine protease
LRKTFSGIILTLLLLSVFSSVYNLETRAVTNASNSDAQVAIKSTKTNAQEQVKVLGHRITVSDLTTLKSVIGTSSEIANYNQLIDGHGTGLLSPTNEEWAKIAANAYIVDAISFNTAAETPSSVDHSNESWFPPIGNQDGQGSCVAWAVGYYMKTYQEAKEHEWNLSMASWEGGYYGHPSLAYQAEIMSSAFVYNLINNGVDGGSTFYDAINLVCSIGISSWKLMPYDHSDYTSWPSEAAWSEAPFYRGNSSSGYEYLSLSTDQGLTDLKNWIASGNLAIIGVDANQYSKLTDDDVWTLDNYANPNENHANTVVGYDDSIEYVEGGQVRHGAFKIVNSWGVGGWENVPDGFYWISYEAMKQRIGYCMFYYDMIDYQPTLLASFNIAHSRRGECRITVGLGNKNSPIQTKRFDDYINGGNQPFCTNDIVFDITEFTTFVTDLQDQSFFLKVYDAGSVATGTISKFAIDNVLSSDTPISTINGAYVYAYVTFGSNAHISVFPEVVELPTGLVVDQNFTVAVIVENVSNLYALGLKLEWNTTYLAYVNHTITVPLENYSDPALPSPHSGILHSPTTVVQNDVNESSGFLSLNCYSEAPASSFTGNGTILTITFQVKNQSTSETNVSLHLAQIELTDSYALPILHAVTDGIVRIPERPPDTTPPSITIISPQNRTFDANHVPLIFTINESTSWISYSFDDQSNVTITSNTTLIDLSDGAHTVVVYANDTSGNMGASEIVYFADDTTPPSIADVSQTPPRTDVWSEDEVKVNATVTDSVSGVKKVTLEYTNGNGTWIILEMTKIEDSIWKATIPQFPYGTNITYTITAEDRVNNTITSEEMGYTYQYRVVSEFSTLWLLPAFMMITLSVIVFCKKKHVEFSKTIHS